MFRSIGPLADLKRSADKAKKNSAVAVAPAKKKAKKEKEEKKEEEEEEEEEENDDDSKKKQEPRWEWAGDSGPGKSQDMWVRRSTKDFFCFF